MLLLGLIIAILHESVRFVFRNAFEHSTGQTFTHRAANNILTVVRRSATLGIGQVPNVCSPFSNQISTRRKQLIAMIRLLAIKSSDLHVFARNLRRTCNVHNV